MRIGIIAPQPVPTATGGAQRAWRGLETAINERSAHSAELVTVPVDERTLPDLISSYRDFAALDVSRFDLVVTSKYPAWMISHPNHVVHMFHPLRGLYDTYHLFGLAPSCTAREPVIRAVVDLVRTSPSRTALPELFERLAAVMTALGADHPELSLPGPLAREVVRFLDRVALDPPAVRRHLALSATVAGRADYFRPSVTPRVVYLPSSLPDLAPGAAVHLFTASRLEPAKRVDLLIRAMAHVGAEVPLLIAGDGPARAELQDLAAGDHRIRFLGPVDDAELARLYADALAVGFVPRDEDYGLIAVEAMTSATPVVTCHDAGGPTELVVDGGTGLVTAATPRAIGAAFSSLVAQPATARRMGRRGAERVAKISWEAAIRVIVGSPLGGPGDRRPPKTTRPQTSGPRLRRRDKVVAVSTFPIQPPFGGGQLRCFHLYGALARRFDVEMVSLAAAGTEASTATIGPGFVARVVPVTAAQERLAQDWSSAVGLPVSDIVAGSVVQTTPAYMDALRDALREASAVVLAHPYLHPAVEVLRPDLPVIYDAFDHEAVLKRAVLPDTPPGRALLARVEAIEARATECAWLVVACSPHDGALLARAHGLDPGSVVLVPNGTVLGPAVPTPAERADAGRRWCRHFADHLSAATPPEAIAVFFASWHPPNLDAAEVIVELATQLPDVAMVLAGSHGWALRSRRLPPNVAVVGVISDESKRTLLRSATVALNPMRKGTGTNLKVIEYLATGVPTISTPFGVRGLGVDDRHVLLAEPEPKALASAFRSALDDPRRVADRVREGRALVEGTYVWDRLGERLADAIASILDHREPIAPVPSQSP